MEALRILANTSLLLTVLACGSDRPSEPALAPVASDESGRPVAEADRGSEGEPTAQSTMPAAAEDAPEELPEETPAETPEKRPEETPTQGAPRRTVAALLAGVTRVHLSTVGGLKNEADVTDPGQVARFIDAIGRSQSATRPPVRCKPSVMVSFHAAEAR